MWTNEYLEKESIIRTPIRAATFSFGAADEGCGGRGGVGLR